MQLRYQGYRKRLNSGISNLIAEAIMLSLTLYVLLIMFGSNSLFEESNRDAVSTLGLELIYCDASSGTTIMRIIKPGIIDAVSNNIENLSLLKGDSEVLLEIPAYLTRNDVILLRHAKETNQPLWIKSGEIFYTIEPISCSLTVIS